MPWNVRQGTNVEFSVRFRDASRNFVTPSSATLSVTYPAASGGTAVAVVGLILNIGQVYTGAWDSSVADLGFATLSVLAPGQLTPTTASLRLEG